MRRAILAALALCLLLPMVGWAQVSSYPATGGGSSALNVNDYTIFDDFTFANTGNSYAGAFNWYHQNASGITASGSVTDRPGVYVITVGATVDSAFHNGSYTVQLANIKSWRGAVAWSTGANAPDKRFGLFSTTVAADPTNDSVYFECLPADTNWFAVTRDDAAAAQTRTDTGVAFTANTYYNLRIDHPSTGRWDFYINDVLTVSTSAGNIPAEASPVAYGVYMATNGTSLTYSIDWLALSIKSSSR